MDVSLSLLRISILILDMSSLDIGIVIFSPVLWFAFLLLMVFFNEQKFLILMKSNLSFF